MVTRLWIVVMMLALLCAGTTAFAGPNAGTQVPTGNPVVATPPAQPAAVPASAMPKAAMSSDGDYDVITKRAAEVPGLQRQIAELQGQLESCKKANRQDISRKNWTGIKNRQSQMAGIRGRIASLEGRVAQLERDVRYLKANPLGGTKESHVKVNKWLQGNGYRTQGQNDKRYLTKEEFAAYVNAGTVPTVPVPGATQPSPAPAPQVPGVTPPATAVPVPEATPPATTEPTPEVTPETAPETTEEPEAAPETEEPAPTEEQEVTPWWMTTSWLIVWAAIIIILFIVAWYFLRRRQPQEPDENHHP